MSQTNCKMSFHFKVLLTKSLIYSGNSQWKPTFLADVSKLNSWSTAFMILAANLRGKIYVAGKEAACK